MLYELRSLSRQYRRGGASILALDGVSLQLSIGEFTAVIGPSGCGKSTLLQILGAIDSDYQGTLYFQGQDVGQMSAAERARLRLSKIGFVFQNFQLLDALNVLENIALPLWRLGSDRRSAETRARELAKELEIDHRLQQRPQQLSIGEMQRAAVARALVCDPVAILADEPTASLDADNARHIIAALESIAQRGRMVLVASHDQAVITRANRILSLDHGRLISDVRNRIDAAPGPSTKPS